MLRTHPPFPVEGDAGAHRMWEIVGKRTLKGGECRGFGSD